MTLKKNTMPILHRPKCNVVYSLYSSRQYQIFVNISHFWNKSLSFFSLLIMDFCIFLIFWILFLYWLLFLFLFLGLFSWLFRWFFFLKFLFGYLENFQNKLDYLSDYCDSFFISWIIFQNFQIFCVFYLKKNLDGFSNFFEIWSSRIGTRTVRSRTKTAPKIKRENWSQVLIFGGKKKTRTELEPVGPLKILVTRSRVPPRTPELANIGKYICV